MGAAIDDVHHRHRQDARGGSAHVTIKRQAGRFSSSLGDRQRHAENCIGPKARLVGRAIERDHRLVDGDLIFGVHAGEGFVNVLVDAGDRFQHALAAITGLVAVAQLNRLMRARRGAGRHCGAAKRAVIEHNFDFHGRIAAAIEDFAGDDVENGGHVSLRAGISLSKPV